MEDVLEELGFALSVGGLCWFVEPYVISSYYVVLYDGVAKIKDKTGTVLLTTDNPEKLRAFYHLMKS